MACDVQQIGFALTLLLGAFGGVLFSIIVILLVSPQPYGPGPRK